MRRFLALFLVLACASLAEARTIVIGQPAAVCDDTTGMLVAENFEGAGTPTDWTTYCTGSTCNFDDTTAALDETESLTLTRGSQNVIAYTPPFAASGTVGVMLRITVGDYTPASNTRIASLMASSADHVYIYLYTTGVIAINNADDSQAVVTVGALTSSTTYLWVDCTKGTGANASYKVAFSDTKVRPLSGNNTASTATGKATANIDQISVKSQAATSPVKVDYVRIDNAAIGDVCR